jgi:uncharacterized protein YbjT (DUF2867 family)
MCIPSFLPIEAALILVQIESASLQDFKSKGASLHAISYEDEDSLVKALQGVDVLVSTVGGSALLSAQIPLIKAAKAVGVKLFFPSGYGSVSTVFVPAWPS